MKENEIPLSEDPSAVDPFEIGDWLVEPALNRVRRGTESVQIEPRIMHVLTCLAGRRGQVVSRSALLSAVWGEVIVNEEALTHAVSQLRRVLGDDPKSPRFIQTIHKTGYRLIAPVTTKRPAGGAEGDSETAAISRTRSDTEARRHRGGSRKKLVTVIGGLIGAVVVISVLTIISRSRSTSPPSPIALAEVPFTSYPGREICPTISPDGTRIAFSWDESEQDRYDLYVKQKNTETPLRLTDTEGDEYYAVWSPDGAELAYAFDSDDGTGIYTIPAIGGAPRKIVDTPHGLAGIDWSADGRLLAYATRPEINQPIRIFLHTFDDGQSRALTTPMPLTRGDYRPVFSPDSRRLAFIRADRTNLQDIFVVPVEGGEPERLTHSQHYVGGLDWTRDGEALVFCSGPTRAGDLRLWQLTLKDRKLTWLPTGSNRPIRPSVAQTGRGLVYEAQSIDSDIYEIGVGGVRGEAVPIITSTRHDYGPQYSPGGEFISFISTRSGSPQIWVCDRDGCNPRQLTRFESAYIENPCWSHDDRRVAFTAAPGNHSSIYVADVETGEVQRVSGSGPSTPSRHEMCLGWSRDGQWLYCKSDRDEGWQVWKMQIAGGSSRGEIVNIMEKDVFRLAESADGSHLIYSRADTSGVWAASIDGTGETCLINEPGIVVPCGWRESAKDIYFFSIVEGSVDLYVQDAVTGSYARLASGTEFFAINLDVAPGGDAVVFDRLEPIGSDLVLAEDF